VESPGVGQSRDESEDERGLAGFDKAGILQTGGGGGAGAGAGTGEGKQGAGAGAGAGAVDNPGVAAMLVKRSSYGFGTAAREAE
jgi:hypothetical protein